MKQDFRKIPYNIWICVLTLVIIACISGLGIKIMYIGETLEPKFEIEGYDEFINYLTPVCQEDTNCSVENVDIKIWVGEYIVDDTKEDNTFWNSYYVPYYRELNESKDMLNVTYEKSFNMKVVKGITMLVGTIIFIVGIILGIIFFAFTIWVDENIKELEPKITKVKKK